jgi:endonuclease/exonuclease/phosphatase (EEP) superfamily protein YafD
VRLAGGAWLASLAALAVAVYGPGERFWPVTFFLLGPRPVVALPLVALLPAAGLLDRRTLAALLAGLALAAEPLFGFELPWRRVLRADGDVAALRVATWNMGGGGRAADALALVGEESPDLLLLQECPPGVETPPGWHRSGERGQVLLSRFPIASTATRDPHDVWEMSGSGEIVRVQVEAPGGRVDVTNVHLETPREGLEAVLGERWRGIPVLEAKNAQREIEARLARRWADASTAPARFVGGDFNATVESQLFREHWDGYRDCHSEAGWGFGHTKHTRRIGARIDHVLAGPGLECVSARTARRSSGDHAPLVVELRPAVR